MSVRVDIPSTERVKDEQVEVSHCFVPVSRSSDPRTCHVMEQRRELHNEQVRLGLQRPRDAHGGFPHAIDCAVASADPSGNQGCWSAGSSTYHAPSHETGHILSLHQQAYRVRRIGARRPTHCAMCALTSASARPMSSARAVSAWFDEDAMARRGEAGRREWGE